MTMTYIDTYRDCTEGAADGVPWGMILVVAVVLAAAQQGEGAVDLGLRYLARHQSTDGSWGRRVAGCGCPAEPGRPTPAADEPTAARIDALLRDFDHEDAGRRDAAQKALVAIGAPAVVPVQAAALAGSVEFRARCGATVDEIRAAGTAGDVEFTGMAVLAYLGAGFSPLSKGEVEGRPLGAVVGSGLRWLIDRQKPDGSFGGGTAAADAWAALALCEAFGLTAVEKYREPAQIAVDHLVANPAIDARGLLYQGMALKSAEISDLEMPKRALEGRYKALAAKRAHEPWSVSLLASIQLLQVFSLKNLRLRDHSGLSGIPVSRMEMETVYVLSLALFQIDGPRGPLWSAHNEEAKLWVIPGQVHEHGRCDRGAWAATGTRERIKSAALATLSREIYYR